MNPKVTSRKKVAREIHGGLGRGVTHTKKTGMLVLFLRGVNCRVWSYSGCLDVKSLVLPIQVSLRTLHKEIYKKCRKTDNVVLIIIII